MSPLIVPLLYPGFGRVTDFLRPHFRITSGLLTIQAQRPGFRGPRGYSGISQSGLLVQTHSEPNGGAIIRNGGRREGRLRRRGGLGAGRRLDLRE